MGAVHYGLALHENIELGSDGLLGDGVKAAGRLIEQEDLGLFLEQAACDEDPLAFTARKLRAKVADLRLVAILHLDDLVVDLAFLAHLDDFLLVSVRVAVLEVEHDAVIKQRAVLRNNRDVLAEAVKRLLGQVLAVDEHSAALRIIDPEE